MTTEHQHQYQSAHYQPGTCNIGPYEIIRRKHSGWAGIVLALVLAAGLFLVDAPPIFRLFLALPAGIATAGFIQARLRFCAAFGIRGRFSVSDRERKVQRVRDAADRRRDLLASARIIGLSALTGMFTALVAYIL